MKNVAILGFGVVGGGVARLLTDNRVECEALGGDSINIKYILDLRDFPDSPFADRIVHDFGIIENDGEIDTVIEVLGGSHPAYEFTVASLRAGKNVITSNKEVVATFGDEFLALAEERGVSYRFEAAVGGGIPVISPLIGFIGQNKIHEVRGILNGTTNYILTKMFTLGESFEAALAQAQAKGYAEKNPDADVLGTDTARKIAILAAIATGKLVSTESFCTEGITNVTHDDVARAEALGYKIKLLARCVVCDGEPKITVAPYMIPIDEMLSGVSGVFNAVEVLGQPIGKAVFYGPGAGAGPTASAVVGDLVQIMRSGRQVKNPEFTKKAGGVSSFSEIESRFYVSLEGACPLDAERAFGGVHKPSGVGGCEIVTRAMTRAECERIAAELGAVIKGAIRILD